MAGTHILLGTVGIWSVVALGLAENLALFLLPLAPCQGSLLSLWAAFGGKGTPWRSLVGVVGVVSYYVIVSSYSGDIGFGVWSAILVVQTLPFVAVLLLARLCGLELSRQCSHRPETGGWRLQFSTARAISWMTAIGICLGVLLGLPKWSRLFGTLELGVCLSCSIVAAASFWLVLGRTRFRLRLVALALSVAIGTFLLGTNIGPLSDSLGSAVLLSVLAAWLVGSLVPVQMAGYRLTWRWRLPRISQPGE
jgi:hypothetical protein